MAKIETRYTDTGLETSVPRGEPIKASGVLYGDIWDRLLRKKLGEKLEEPAPQALPGNMAGIRRGASGSPRSPYDPRARRMQDLEEQMARRAVANSRGVPVFRDLVTPTPGVVGGYGSQLYAAGGGAGRVAAGYLTPAQLAAMGGTVGPRSSETNVSPEEETKARTRAATELDWVSKIAADRARQQAGR